MTASLVLGFNVLLGRLIAFGLFSLPKTVCSVVAFSLVIVLGRFIRNRVASGYLVLAYAFWLPFLIIPCAFERHSLLPVSLPFLICFVAITIDAFRINPKLSKAMLGVTAALITFLALELLAPLLPRAYPHKRIILDPPGMVVEDSLLGYKARPGYRGRATCMHKDSLVYNVGYATDEFGRRLTPVLGSSIRTSHVIFDGCSFVFGDGVENWETLPAHFARMSDHPAVYNYGLGGYGPHQTLEKLRSGTLHNEIPENTGVMIYCLMPAHIERVLGTYLTQGWQRNSPRFVMTRVGLLRHGRLGDLTPLTARLFQLVRGSRILDFIASRADMLYSQIRNLSPLVPLMTACAEEYENQFDGNFHVLVWPSLDQRAPALVDALEIAGARVIDLASLGLPPAVGGDLQIPFDGHPTSKYYRLTARMVHESLARSAITVSQANGAR